MSEDAGSAKPGDEEKKDGSGPGNACDYCRRLKMKCIGKDNPPCQRCRGSKKPCTFGMESKVKAQAGSQAIDKRLQGLEDQMGWIQSSLQAMISNQQAMAMSGMTGMAGMAASMPGMGGMSGMAAAPGRGMSGQPSKELQGRAQGSAPEQSQQPWPTALPPAPPPHLPTSGITPGPSGPYGHLSSSFSGPLPSGIQNVTPPQYDASSGYPLDPSPHGRPSTGSFSQDISPRAHPPPHAPLSFLQRQTQDQTQNQNQARLNAGPRGPISPRSQPRIFEPLHPFEDPNDPSPDIPLRSLASRLDVARLVADGHVVPTEDDENGQDEPPSARRSPSFDPLPLGLSDGRPAKRARFESETSQDGRSPASRTKTGLRSAMPRQKGDLARAFSDPVDMGLCSDAEGRKLVDTYFSACHPFIPVYDPATDTWDSLRHRSPFSVSVLMLVGKHVEDAGGLPSTLQMKCKEHAELIGKSTVFSPVANVEAVQALMVLSCWGDTVWRPGHLAFSIAVDMGLYRCLPYLAETGMGAGKDAQSLEEERSLVVGARVWIALYKLRYEMAYNHGRPVLMTDDDTLLFARRLLEHPLSNPSDSRLVASCELLALRVSMHQPLSYRPSVPIPDLDTKLTEADRDVQDWFRYWDGYYESHGLPVGHFLRESLISQMCHAILYASMRVLHTVKDRKSAALLPEHRRRRVEDGVRAAQRLIDMTLRGKQYKQTFIYANHYQHVGVAFTARTLIRLASLFPDVVDLKQASRDLEQLVQLLRQVPGFQIGQMIEEVLRRARRKQVLPPLSKPPSPRFGQRGGTQAQDRSTAHSGQYNDRPGDNAVLGTNSNNIGAAPYQSDHPAGYSPDIGSVESQPLFDFSLAEELLTGPSGAATGAAPQPVEPSIIDPLFDPNLWFSFFPNADFGLGPSGFGGGTATANDGTQPGTDPFLFNGNGDAPLW